MSLETDLPNGIPRMHNSSHKNAWCFACVDAYIETRVNDEGYDEALGLDGLVTPSMVISGRRKDAVRFIKPLRGVESDLLKHLIKCPHVTRSVKDFGVKRRLADGTIVTPSPTPLTQTQLKVVQTPTAWSITQQEEFKRDFLRLWLATNASFNTADLPATRAFFTKWIGLPNPSKSILRARLLDDEYSDILAKNESLLKHSEGTLLCDGWNNRRRRHLVTFMFMVDGEGIPVRNFDNSSLKRDGQLAFDQILEVLEYLKGLGADVLGVCTDNGADQVSHICSLLASSFYR